jgi:hypothetical protein
MRTNMNINNQNEEIECKDYMFLVTPGIDKDFMTQEFRLGLAMRIIIPRLSKGKPMWDEFEGKKMLVWERPPYFIEIDDPRMVDFLKSLEKKGIAIDEIKYFIQYFIDHIQEHVGKVVDQYRQVIGGLARDATEST